MKKLSLFILVATLLAACDSGINAEKNSILTTAHWAEKNADNTWHLEFRQDGTFNERYTMKDGSEISMQGTWKWINENEVKLNADFITVLEDKQPIASKGNDDTSKVLRFKEFEKSKISGVLRSAGDEEN